MPVDYAIHPLGNPVQGNHPPAPSLPLLGGQSGLADNTNSNVILLATDAVISIVATAKLRLDVQNTVAALNPAASPLVLIADQPRLFALPRGTYYLKTLAYV
jgi:hypothetical protein